MGVRDAGYCSKKCEESPTEPFCEAYELKLKRTMGLLWRWATEIVQEVFDTGQATQIGGDDGRGTIKRTLLATLPKDIPNYGSRGGRSPSFSAVLKSSPCKTTLAVAFSKSYGEKKHSRRVSPFTVTHLGCAL